MSDIVMPTDAQVADGLAPTDGAPLPSGETAQATASSRKRWPLLVALAALAVAVSGGAFWYLTQPQVPDVVGTTAEGAIEALETEGFAIGKVVYDESAEGEQGSVVSQEPEAGRRVEEGTAVNIVIAGPPPVPVPDLSGVDASQAESALEAIGLALGSVTESYHDTVMTGLVISQDTEAGVDSPVGSKIDIVVSKGPEPVAVPSVVGVQEGDAVAALQAAGFNVATVWQDNAASKGTVLAQDPPADQRLVPGSSVTVVVSTGVEMVRVPNVFNLWIADAEAAIAAAGLRPKSISVYATDADYPLGNLTEFWGYVYKQSPKAGSMVPRGTEVKYYWAYEMG